MGGGSSHLWPWHSLSGPYCHPVPPSVAEAPSLVIKGLCPSAFKACKFLPCARHRYRPRGCSKGDEVHALGIHCAGGRHRSYARVAKLQGEGDLQKRPHRVGQGVWPREETAGRGLDGMKTEVGERGWEESSTQGTVWAKAGNGDVIEE